MNEVVNIFPQEFVVPDLLTFFLMVMLGVLAFFAEVSMLILPDSF